MSYSLEEPEAEPEMVYTADSLSELTIAQIKELASERGYSITKTLKADIINEFLEQQ